MYKGGRRIKYRRNKSSKSFFKRESRYNDSQSWNLNSKKSSKRKIVFLFSFIIIFCLGIFIFWPGKDKKIGQIEPPQVLVDENKSINTNSNKRVLLKSDLARLMGTRLLGAETKAIKIKGPADKTLYIMTTLDPKLQDWAVKAVKKSGAVKCVLVVLNPKTGEVLALASHQPADYVGHAALKSDSPAASFFKVVVAAGAMEKAKFTASSNISFDGGNTTLYKNQVNTPLDVGANKKTLAQWFAESANSPFAKIGIQSLGAEGLKETAKSFAFNAPLNFDMLSEMSQFIISEDYEEYELAELASGFNRTTTISPLHAAIIASVTVNGGYLLEPWIVKEVFDEKNRLFYQGKINNLGAIVSLQTASELSGLMMATIIEGTAKQTFNNSGTHPILSKLLLGGKTGTLSNDLEQRVDWFVAWARPIGDNDLENAIVVSALVVHEGLTTVTSQDLARAAIIKYYQPIFLVKNN